MLQTIDILVKYVQFLDYLLIVIFASFFLLPLFRYCKKRIKSFRRSREPVIYDDDGNQIRYKYGRAVIINEEPQKPTRKRRGSLVTFRNSECAVDTPCLEEGLNLELIPQSQQSALEANKSDADVKSGNHPDVVSAASDEILLGDQLMEEMREAISAGKIVYTNDDNLFHLDGDVCSPDHSIVADEFPRNSDGVENVDVYSLG